MELLIIAGIVLFLLYSNGVFDGENRQQKEFEEKRKNEMLEYERLEQERLQEYERSQEEKAREEIQDYQDDYSEEMEDKDIFRDEVDYKTYNRYEGLSPEEAEAARESEDDD